MSYKYSKKQIYRLQNGLQTQQQNSKQHGLNGTQIQCTHESEQGSDVERITLPAHTYIHSLYTTGAVAEGGV